MSVSRSAGKEAPLVIGAGGYYVDALGERHREGHDDDFC